jgi:hypothetical protein
MGISPNMAHNSLSHAKSEGIISDFIRSDQPGRVFWVIDVPGTHYAEHFESGSKGQIVLTTREVMAFIEGTWAALKINPVNRAGAESGSAVRDFES